jgi:hypothetical protein
MSILVQFWRAYKTAVYYCLKIAVHGILNFFQPSLILTRKTNISRANNGYHLRLTLKYKCIILPNYRELILKWLVALNS